MTLSQQARDGDYFHCSFTVVSPQATADADPTATSPWPGFIRVADNQQHFAVDSSGDTWFAVGENLAWVREGSKASATVAQSAHSHAAVRCYCPSLPPPADGLPNDCHT